MNTPTLTEAAMFYMRYHPKTGLVALVELDALNAAADKRETLRINGVKQQIVSKGKTTPKHKAERGVTPVPLVKVEHEYKGRDWDERK